MNSPECNFLLLLITTSVFIEYEYLVSLLVHKAIANFKLIVYELP